MSKHHYKRTQTSDLIVEIMMGYKDTSNKSLLVDEFVVAVLGRAPELVLPSKRFISRYLIKNQTRLVDLDICVASFIADSVKPEFEIPGSCIFGSDLERYIDGLQLGNVTEADSKLVESWINHQAITNTGRVINSSYLAELHMALDHILDVKAVLGWDGKIKCKL